MADGKRPKRSNALADVPCSSEREHATSLMRRRGESTKSGASIITISSSAKASDSSKIADGVTVAIMTANVQIKGLRAFAQPP